MAPASLRQYTGAWERSIAPQWADVQADGVRPIAVQTWLDGLRKGAANISVIVMRQTLDYAVRYELLDSNPMDVRYHMPSPSTTRRRDDGIWSLDELATISGAMMGSWIEAAYILCAYGSCRVGESLAVRAEDVGRREVDGVTLAVVRVHSQVTDAHGLTETLKTPQSARSVVIPGEHAERIFELAKASESGWLTDNGIGGYPWPSVVRKEWERVMASDELPPWHPFKQLRASWETYMRWSLHLAPWLTEKMMGHVGEGVTGRHYDKPDEDLFCETVARAWSVRPY